MDIYDFRQIKQDHGEALQYYYRRLKEKVIVCDFPHEDYAIKHRLFIIFRIPCETKHFANLWILRPS